MPLYLLAMQSPPQLVLWSSLERRRRRPCIDLEQERRQRPEGRLAVLQTLSFHARKEQRVIECCFRVRCHSNQSRLQVAIAGRRTRRVEGGTLQRGVSDETPDDHGNKQNRQAGNAWHADWARKGAARRLPQPRKSMGLCGDQFAHSHLRIKFVKFFFYLRVFIKE